MKDTGRLIFDEDGVMHFIYDDDLRDLLDEGEAHCARASHVEPVEGGRRWTADMSPVNGPMLGPFNTHQEAIDAEVEWIERNVLDAS